MTQAEKLAKSTQAYQCGYYQNELLHRILRAEPVKKKVGYRSSFYEFADGSQLIEVNNRLNVKEDGNATNA